MGRFRYLSTSALFLALALSGRIASAADLTVAWDASPDPTIAGYMIFYGTQSGLYSSSVDAGLHSSQPLTGLADGTTYYFIVRAYTTTGAMSAPSAEVAILTGASTTPPSATSAPTISCPAPSGTSSTGGPIPLTFSPTVSGGTAPVTSTCSPASGSLFPVGSTPLTCNATDAKQLTASCSSAATVTAVTAGNTPVPTIAPLAISCPLVTQVVSHSGNPVKVTFAPTTTGGVAPITTTCTPPSGSNFNIGMTAVMCSAVDASGATDSCATSVIVTSAKPGSSPGVSGTPTTVDGTISALTGSCPTTSFQLNGFAVSTLSATSYAKGSCSSLASGKNVHVEGLAQSDGSIIATAITFTK